MNEVDLKKVGEVLDKYSQNYDWFNTHYAKLKNEYPNRKVAVDKGKVIGTGKNMAQLRKKFEKRSEVFFGSVIAEELLWIL